jgi:hypothetical protein
MVEMTIQENSIKSKDLIVEWMKLKVPFVTKKLDEIQRNQSQICLNTIRFWHTQTFYTMDLDRLSYSELQDLCSFFKLGTFGTRKMLQASLSRRIEALRIEDKVIY